MNRAAVLKALRRLRSGGRRIVFTNGCFDVLHPGHLRLLTRAKALGDVLVVGLNSDGSVRRLKGKGRPLHAFRDRRRMLEALKAVDYVVGFGEDTPERLLGRIRPDILVKGADWKASRIAGRRFAGRVVRIPLAPGHSTTKILKRWNGLP